MVTCANCESPAELVYEITPSLSILYCSKHVPRSVRAKFAGALKPYVAETEPAKAKKSKSTPVVEEPVVEETDDADGAD
jgi:hypothetical protein